MPAVTAGPLAANPLPQPIPPLPLTMQTPSALPPGAQPGFPNLRICRVAAKSHPDMAGLGTGATAVSDACLSRCAVAQGPHQLLPISPGCASRAGGTWEWQWKQQGQ